jgi:FMN-dependent NADH-azoreductase
MNTLLIVNSSPRSNSVSRSLTRRVAEDWRAHNPDGRMIERDLMVEPLPFLTESWIQASTTPAAQRTPEQQQALALSDALIEELLAADVIVLGVPMHNFSIPASLKAWIDLITRAGKTFSYGDKGPQGLIPEGKQVLAIVSRGGVYGEGTPAFSADFQVPYLRHMLGFIGLKNVTVIEADKQAFGPDAAQQSVDNAVKKLSALTENCNAQLAASA